MFDIPITTRIETNPRHIPVRVRPRDEKREKEEEEQRDEEQPKDENHRIDIKI